MSARFRTDCVKMYEDGVPTESHTAAMIDPYEPGADGHLHEPARGMLLVGPATLDPLLTRLDKMGITVKFHAAGDQASRTALDAIAAARKANGPDGPMHEVGHLTFVNPADLARAKAIRATLEFSPYLWFPSPINDDIIKAIGEERIKRVWPVREGIDSGALVIAGSDWSVVPSANPWIGIETLVTRRAPTISARARYTARPRRSRSRRRSTSSRSTPRGSSAWPTSWGRSNRARSPI
ncbi:amidohydrolase family protein [Rhizorhabdus histidinilytica]